MQFSTRIGFLMQRTLRSVLPAITLVGYLLLASGCDIFGTAIDERAPSVEILRPFDQATVSGKHVLIAIAAEALSADNFISFINVNVNGVRAGEAALDSTGFNFRLDTFNFEDGLYRIEAVAFDRFQARGISAPILVTIANKSDGIGPEMQIITPDNDERVGGLVRVVARTQPVQPFVTRVDLLVDGVAIASSNNVLGGNSFVFDWDALNEAAGEHFLEVKAYSGPTTFRLSDSKKVIVRSDGSSGGDGRPGSVRWRAAGYKGDVKGSVAVGFNNDIYVATSSDTLYAFSRLGSLKWKFATKGPIRSSPLVGNNEDVFVTSEDGRLYGLNSTGVELWPPYNTGALLRSSPTLGVEGRLYFGDSDGKVHAVNSFNGLTVGGRWPVSVSSSPIVVPPVIARDRTVVVATTDGFLHALAPDGTLLWTTRQNVGSIMVGMALIERQLTVQLPTNQSRTSTAVIVYAVSNDGLIYAIAAEDGSVLWSYPLTGPLRSGPVVGTDGAIYVGTSTGLIALNEDADAFTPRLRFVYPASDVGTPVVDANEVIYFVSRRTVFAINPNNTPFWDFDLGTQSDGPITINREGGLLVAGQNGLMTSLETGSVGLAPGKWPMFQRNARHTGRLGIDADDG
jgi:outer membrane protein assembly factor BamB